MIPVINSRSHCWARLVGIILILGVIACSCNAVSLGAMRPTPTPFVWPTPLLTPTPSSPTETSLPPGSFHIEITIDFSQVTMPTSYPTERPSSLGVLDVCTFYTQSDFEALYGEPMTGSGYGNQSSPNDGTVSYFCYYVSQTGYNAAIFVTHHESVESASRDYQPGFTVDPPQVIDGIGDEAYFEPEGFQEDDSDLVVRQGVFIISIRLSADNNLDDTPAPPLDVETVRHRAQAIAQIVLSRLPQ